MKLILILIGAGFSVDALGCAVCGFGEDGTREAFLFTTALLTLIPLIMIGAGVFYLTRVAKRAEREFEKVRQIETV